MRDAARSFVESLQAPTVFARIVERQYAARANDDFVEYVHTTLSHNRRAGGRFNAPTAFGVLYAASDEATA